MAKKRSVWRWAMLGRYKMGKHLQLTIEEDRFDWQRKPASIEREAALDGSYVIRTSVPASDLTLVRQVVATYKGLSTVERAFRSMKKVDLKVRPIRHHHPERVSLMCSCAYWPIMWSPGSWRRCCSMRKITRQPKRNDAAS